MLGWALWDIWITRQDAAAAAVAGANPEAVAGEEVSSTSSASSVREPHGLGLVIPDAGSLQRRGHSPTASATLASASPTPASPVTTGHPTGAASFANYSHYPPYGGSSTSLSPRNQQRLATVKSAILIYCALLGLSPILKSLTKSISSDSIWALSTWLMCINVFFFHYDGTPGAK